MSLPIFPAADFDAVIEANAKGNHLNLPALVYFDFRDEPLAVWGGGYDLISGGTTWAGLGKSGFLVSIEGLGDSGTMQASEFNLTVSGADPGLIEAFATEDRADFVGRLCGVYAQFCDADWQPLCSPYAVCAGIMGPLVGSRTPSDKGGWQRTISLTNSNIFYGRDIPPAAYFTDRDQKLRHPGDRFLEFVASIQETHVDQPWR